MRKLFFPCIALALLALSPRAEAAVACVYNCTSATEIVNNSPTSPISDTTHFTVPTGSNEVLVVTVVVALAASTVSATWNGMSMSVIENNGTGDTTTTNVLLCLAAPTTGNHTLAITYSGTPANVDYIASVYTGANQTTPCKNGTSSQSTSANPFSLAITSASGDIVTALFSESGSTPSISTGTQIFTDTSGTDTQETAGYNTGGSPTATVAASDTANQHWNAVGMDIASATVASNPVLAPFFTSHPP